MDDATAVNTDLSSRLTSVRAMHPGLTDEMTRDVIHAVFDHTGTDGLASSLLAEVADLGRAIANTKAEIASLRVDDITGQHIPAATDELSAIVAHTASATDQILEVCETLDDVGAKLEGDMQTRLQDATTRIYEACSFQDITGQRITKVVTTLKTIEAKISHIITTFGVSEVPSMPEALAPASPEDELLNGPQLPALAMDQSDIDKLMASFD